MGLVPGGGVPPYEGKKFVNHNEKTTGSQKQKAEELNGQLRLGCSDEVCFVFCFCFCFLGVWVFGYMYLCMSVFISDGISRVGLG